MSRVGNVSKILLSDRLLWYKYTLCTKQKLEGKKNVAGIFNCFPRKQSCLNGNESNIFLQVVDKNNQVMAG